MASDQVYQYNEEEFIKDWSPEHQEEFLARKAALKEKKRRRRLAYRENCKTRGKSLKKRSNWSLAQEALSGHDDSGLADMDDVEEFLRPFFKKDSLEEFTVDRPPRDENWEPFLEARAKKLAAQREKAKEKAAMF